MIENFSKTTLGYLRLPQVLQIIPVSRSTWYRGMKSGLYPQPVKLGARASGWKIEAIQGCARDLEKASISPWDTSFSEKSGRP